MKRNQKAVYYSEYLELNKFLDSQHPLSKQFGIDSHDEMLFIIVHQAYELWFKQILHEMYSMIKVFKKTYVDDKELSIVVARLERIHKIQGLLMDQIPILETMTPMDFLEFRDILIPASGFQSIQFKEIETRLGITPQTRYSIDKDSFLGRLSSKDRSYLENIEREDSILKLIENWLERMPFTNEKNFKFWEQYEKAVFEMLNRDEAFIEENTHMGDLEKNIQRQFLKTTHLTFESLFDEKIYLELQDKQQRRFSQRAYLNALFIFLYRDEPQLNLPFRFLNGLIELDENFTSWRYRHSMLAHRMLGTKIGTGGSAGHDYLKKAADQNRIFLDLYNLSTFLIPKSALPTLPEDILKTLHYHVAKKETPRAPLRDRPLDV
jgi:tryptophan 2,3-dioxygenase